MTHIRGGPPLELDEEEELDDELEEEELDPKPDEEDADDEELPRPLELEEELEASPDEDEDPVSEFPPLPGSLGPRVVPWAQAKMTSGTEITRAGRTWRYRMDASYSAD